MKRIITWWLGLNALFVVALVAAGGRPDTNLVPHDTLPLLLKEQP